MTAKHPRNGHPPAGEREAVPARSQSTPSRLTGGFDPRRATATPRHAQIAARYQAAYTVVDFAAAVAFIIGSVFFFKPDLNLAADWLFLAGSILFAVRPTVAVAQQIHLARLPVGHLHIPVSTSPTPPSATSRR